MRRLWERKQPARCGTVAQGDAGTAWALDVAVGIELKRSEIPFIGTLFFIAERQRSKEYEQRNQMQSLDPAR